MLMCDFNTIIFQNMDRIRTDTLTGTSELTSFGCMVQETAFIDLWRRIHLNARQYSCHSSTYHPLSQIDLMLGNTMTRIVTIWVENLTQGVSDHSPMLLELQIPRVYRAPSSSWKRNPFWLSITDTQWVIDALSEYFSPNCRSTDIHNVWDASKPGGSLIHQISRLKITRGQLQRACKDRVRLTEAAYIAKQSVEMVHEWRQAQEALNAQLLESASNKCFSMKHTLFEEGERAGHMLASIAKAQLGPFYITN